MPWPWRWRRGVRTGAWRSSRVAAAYGLGFLPLQPEHYDFLVPTARRDRPPVIRFIELLADPAVRSGLTDHGFLGMTSPGSSGCQQHGGVVVLNPCRP